MKDKNPPHLRGGGLPFVRQQKLEMGGRLYANKVGFEIVGCV